MTIDKAIEKFKFIANSDTPCPRYCMLPCDKCVDESKQIADWLEELKMYKSLAPMELVEQKREPKWQEPLEYIIIGLVIGVIVTIKIYGGFI